nr:ribonuclease H-like domain, reverse transcriptase, RNA-dependent DNA polymerase [Tanacetum cinerariifolium]
ASLDRKSTTGSCQFLRKRLISWQCKKKTVVANSTTEAEYVAAASCCGQDSTKVKTVNEGVQIRALIDGKKIIVTEASIRRDLQLQDAEGTACLPNDIIFEELARMCAKTTAWNEFNSTMASAIICLTKNQKFNFFKYIFDNMVKNLEVETFVIPSLTKKIFANIKGEGKGYSEIITPLFETMMVQALEEVGEGLEVLTDTHHTLIVTSPSSSQPHKKQKLRRIQRKETEVPHIKPQIEESVPTHSNEPLPSGEDRMQLSELMKLCTKLSDMVLSLEQIKTNQAAEIEKLKKIDSFDEKGLGDQEDASKQGRIAEIDVDEDLFLIDETAQDQGKLNEEEMFGVDDLDGDEVIMDVTTCENVEQSTKAAEKEVSIVDPVTTACEVVTTAEDVEVTTAATTL